MGTLLVKNILQFIIDEYASIFKEAMSEKMQSEWKQVQVQSPQQQNGFDCGAFICLNAFCILTEQVENFDQSCMGRFRQKLCYMLLQENEI